MTSLPTHQVPGLHHRRVGDLVVSAVSDGFLDGSMAVLRNIEESEAAQMLRDAFRPVPRRTAVNCFLIRTADRTALVDCGSGTTMQASAGKLLENLRAAAVPLDAIDTILLTHMHPDHSNALIDAEGRPNFPRATVMMHEAELAYWDDAAGAAAAKQSGQGVQYHAAGQAQIAPYRDRIRTFRDGEEVFPGVTAVHLPGHTPGHSGYQVGSAAEGVLIWGDITHVPEIQVARPTVAMQFDVDIDAAVATRQATLERVASSGQLVAGMHINFPGYAHVAKRDGAYALFPEAWRLDF